MAEARPPQESRSPPVRSPGNKQHFIAAPAAGVDAGPACGARDSHVTATPGCLSHEFMSERRGRPAPGPGAERAPWASGSNEASKLASEPRQRRAPGSFGLEGLGTALLSREAESLIVPPAPGPKPGLLAAAGDPTVFPLFNLIAGKFEPEQTCARRIPHPRDRSSPLRTDEAEFPSRHGRGAPRTRKRPVGASGRPPGCDTLFPPPCSACFSFIHPLRATGYRDAGCSCLTRVLGHALQGHGSRLSARPPGTSPVPRSGVCPPPPSRSRSLLCLTGSKRGASSLAH